MRIPPIRRFAVCSTVSLAVACLSLPAAGAQTIPTTPVPTPEQPGQPPGSRPPETPQPSPVVADAGTGIGMLRVLPQAVPGESILDAPDFDKKIPRQALLEAGMGLAVAKANSEAYLAQERAIAESRPFGFGMGGYAPMLPGSLAQTAVPDNEEPRTTGLEPPSSPADKLLDFGVLEGRVHARWSEKKGPCVDPISDARTSLASVSAVNVLPSLKRADGELASLQPGAAASGLDAATTQKLRDEVEEMSGPLQRLGGLLGEGGPNAGSLLRVDDLTQARSSVRLVDVASQDTKAVRATSRFQLGSVRLFAGTSQELRIDVVSKPTLTATATGNTGTSNVEYKAPLLRISKGGEEIAVLDAANPNFEMPIGIPLPGSGIDSDVPLLGHSDAPNVIDLGVLKLSLGKLEKQIQGNRVLSSARLFDLKILPSDLLGFSTALAQISFGEQFARAEAPEGGVDCGTTPAPTPPQAQPAGNPPPPLAKTSGAYHVIPLFWTGTVLLLLGAVLVAALPRRR